MIAADTIALGDALLITIIVAVSFWVGVFSERADTRPARRRAPRRTAAERHTRSHWL